MPDRAAPVRDPYRTALEVGAILASSLELEDVLQAIAREVGLALDVQWCDINEYDAANRTMTYAAVWSERLRQVDLDYVGTVVRLDERPGRDAVIRHGDVLETHADDEDLDPFERRLMLEYDEKAALEVPLVFGGETIGVLGAVESRRARRFSDDEKRLLRMLAVPAAIAIGNARLYREQGRSARRKATLLETSRALAASLDLDEILGGVARLAAEFAGLGYATVYEYRPHHDAIVFTATYERVPSPDGVPDDALGTVYRLAELPGERAILEGAEIVQEHLSDEGLPADRRASMRKWRQQSCLSVPLRSGDAPQGVLRLTSVDEERRFTDGEIELLRALGELAAAAIHNARLFRDQDEQSERLLGLFEVSGKLAATFDPEVIAMAAESGVGRLFRGARAGRLWRRDETGALAPAASRPADADAAPEMWRLVDEAFSTGQPAQKVTDAGSALAVPLVVKTRVDGVIVACADGYHRFSSAEREALQVLANQAAAAGENVRLYRRAEQQAIRDGLTGLYNHRHFQERLREECARARRYGTPLSLLMLDLDEFKSFNDRFGHQVGDEVLHEVGEILFAETRRGVDLAARYGGEEFAVILPHTPADGEQHATPADRAAPEAPPPGAGALVVAERLRAAIAGRAFAGHGGRRHAHVTATIGVAELGAEERSPEALIARADAALYAGKRTGRDRVVTDGR